MSSHQIETQAFKESFERFLELDDCAIFGDIMHYDYYDFEENSFMNLEEINCKSGEVEKENEIMNNRNSKHLKSSEKHEEKMYEEKMNPTNYNKHYLISKILEIKERKERNKELEERNKELEQRNKAEEINLRRDAVEKVCRLEGVTPEIIEKIINGNVTSQKQKNKERIVLKTLTEAKKQEMKEYFNETKSINAVAERFFCHWRTAKKVIFS